MDEDFSQLDLGDLGSMAALFGSMAGSATKIESFADERISRRLSRYDPLKAALTFANLLLHPKLQGNNYRAEILVHLALAYANGKARIDSSALRYLYNCVGEGLAGQLEDPPEDVLVYQVRSKFGNFRILEGMWEGGGFYLQRIIDVVEMMPLSVLFDGIQRSVLSLLRLSEAICDRASLPRWTCDDDYAVNNLRRKDASSLLGGRKRLSFSGDELKLLGIDRPSLAPFLYEIESGTELLNESPNGSPLERSPLISEGENLHVVLPTAISAAIRSHVITALQSNGFDESLKKALVGAYFKHWRETPLLGAGTFNNIDFEEEDGVWWGELSVEIDVGRPLHMLFVVDPLEDFEETGVGEIWNGMALAEIFDRRILKICKAAQNEDLRSGLTLIVSCGVGRGFACGFGEEDTPNWNVEFISAYDLTTLSWLPDFDILTLCRLLEQSDKAQALGMALMNINGLVNLVGWSRMLDGHVVPHAELPDGTPTTLVGVDQTALRKVRHSVAMATDPQVSQGVNGHLHRIRKDFDGTFPEDVHLARYASEDSGAGGKPMAVYLAPKRTWWADVITAEGTDGRIAYERWKTIQVWLSKAAPELDKIEVLPEGPIQWTAIFEGPSTDGPIPNERLNYEESRAELRVKVDGSTIITHATKSFELAWLAEENIAEKALVAALIEGISEMAGDIGPEQSQKFIDAIVSHPLAKQQHGFMARNFRDWVRENLSDRPIMITTEQDAVTRLGLGWKVRDQSLGNWVEGQSECNSFLGELVGKLEDEICDTLKGFERKTMVSALLRNHELACFDRDIWNRTAASNIALRQNRESAVETLMLRQAKLSASSQMSRLLIEMAISECPLGSGIRPGVLDLSGLLAKMMLVFKLGGWSDAIRWGAMKPKLRITPLGDVHGTFDWYDKFVAPYGEKTGTDKVHEAEGDYARNLEELPLKPTVDLDTEFDAAWTEQFGATFQETRIFIEYIENLGRESGKAILELGIADMRNIEIDGQAISDQTINDLVKDLILKFRPAWRKPPDGYEPKDIFPWRFKRKLSVLRKPLIQVDDTTIIIAPGMLREAFVYMLGGYMQGEFPQAQLKPLMKKWQDKVISEKGEKLSADLAEKMQKVGWTTWTEKGVREILGKKMDRDFGDVDVLARKGDRVLIIECKDLKYAKTDGEITEQVRDYRGEERDGKRDELKKHLDRLDVLRTNLEAVGKYVGLTEIAKIESHLVFRNPTPVIFALAESKLDVNASLLTDAANL